MPSRPESAATQGFRVATSEGWSKMPGRSSIGTLPGGPGMITKFDSLFAGHIDMENAGYAGTPVNERRFPNEDLAGVFDKAQAMAQLMDRVGYNAFWMAEHHFQHEGYECIPNVLMTALHLAHVTTRLKIGCGFNITPMWHPLRLAEDYATADILTGGATHFLARGRLPPKESRTF